MTAMSLSDLCDHFDALMSITDYSKINWSPTYVPIANLKGAIGNALNTAFTNQKFSFPFTEQAPKKAEQLRINYINSLIDRAIDEGAIVVRKPKFTEAYYSIKNDQLKLFFNRVGNDGEASDFAKEIGSRYILDALRNVILGEGIIGETLSIESSPLADANIPAADRIVTLDHNQPDYETITEGIDELREAVRGANGISHERRSQALSGLDAAKSLWSAAQLSLVQVEIGIILAIDDAISLLGDSLKKLSNIALSELIRAYIKASLGAS